MTVPVPAIGDGRSQSKVTGLNWRLTYWSRKGSENNQICTHANVKMLLLHPLWYSHQQGGDTNELATVVHDKKSLPLPNYQQDLSVSTSMNEWMTTPRSIHSSIHSFILAQASMMQKRNSQLAWSKPSHHPAAEQFLWCLKPFFCF